MLSRIGRWWIALAAVGFVVSSLGVTTSWSYLKTIWSGVGQTIRDATPISFELDRLNQMLRDLEPEIRKNQHVVAQLEVEVEYLQRECEKLKEQQTAQAEQMKKLRIALVSDKQQYEFGGRTFSRQQVEQDLARRLDQYQEQQRQLAAKEHLLQQRQRTLEAATVKVNEYRRQYDQLAAKAESLTAELKLLEAAQAAGSHQLDDSKLAQAKQLAQEVEKRIRVGQRMLDAQRAPEGEIPVNADTRSAAERYDELFGPESAAQPQMAASK